ncbi:hypothetical protein U1Q18_041492 [Sarracenia purpurea var. burkii]
MQMLFLNLGESKIKKMRGNLVTFAAVGPGYILNIPTFGKLEARGGGDGGRRGRHNRQLTADGKIFANITRRQQLQWGRRCG